MSDHECKVSLNWCTFLGLDDIGETGKHGKLVCIFIRSFFSPWPFNHFPMQFWRFRYFKIHVFFPHRWLLLCAVRELVPCQCRMSSRDIAPTKVPPSIIPNQLQRPKLTVVEVASTSHIKVMYVAVSTIKGEAEYLTDPISGPKSKPNGRIQISTTVSRLIGLDRVTICRSSSDPTNNSTPRPPNRPL